MDRNLLLAFALSFAVLVLWSMTQPPPPPRQPAAPAERPAETVPGVPAPSEPMAAPAIEFESPAPEPVAAPAERIPVETELFSAELDTRGARIASWELTRYHTAQREGALPIALNTAIDEGLGAAATPFRELGFGDLSQAVFEVVERGPEQYVFRYVREGVVVEKSYVFQPDSYGFELRLSVSNGSTRELAPGFVVEWPAAMRDGNDYREQSLAVLQAGSHEMEMLAGFGTSGFFGGEPERTVGFERDVDWVAVETTYFVSALIPDQPGQANGRLHSLDAGRVATAQIYYDPARLPPGQSIERVFRAYAGPKEPERLAAMGGELSRSIDLGWSWMAPLTRFFGWLLHVLAGVLPGHNYGVAIIVMTILVRVVTAPLTNKQMRSMERMRALAPKLQELKEKHAEDRQKQSEEMMRLYRQEGVNPLGGCFPMLLQFPVFIGLFYALRSSIDLRHAPFALWIDDLSAPDVLFDIPGLGIPLRILPLIMGATMWAQQAITPMQQMDPAQQKMMKTVMPLVMTVVFYQFPSGLVLYWMVSNVLGVAHQLWIGRHLNPTGGSGVRVEPRAS